MKNECDGCRYYDADDDICGALECDGMDCDTPLPCELRETEYTDENAIADLNAIKEYFEEESGGCVPICLEYAIEALKKESCEDCISRQAVLDEMYKRKADGDAITAGFIKNLPPVTPAEKVGRWIPVSERLPKVADCYAVTKAIGSDLVTGACFFDRPNIWYDDNRRNLERNYLTNIVAWMPMPEPYKAESEDKE